MGYPTTNMQYLAGMVDAIPRINAATLNVALQKHYDSRTFVYLQQALALWDSSYTGPFNGHWTADFAAKLDAQWSQAWGAASRYAKDSAGNYPLAFFKDFINGDGGLGADAPPVVA